MTEDSQSMPAQGLPITPPGCYDPKVLLSRDITWPTNIAPPSAVQITLRELRIFKGKVKWLVPSMIPGGFIEVSKPIRFINVLTEHGRAVMLARSAWTHRCRGQHDVIGRHYRFYARNSALTPPP